MCCLLIWQQILVVVKVETVQPSLSLLLLHREDVNGLPISLALAVLCLSEETWSVVPHGEVSGFG